MAVLTRDDHEAAARLDRTPEPVPASLRGILTRTPPIRLMKVGAWQKPRIIRDYRGMRRYGLGALSDPVKVPDPKPRLTDRVLSLDQLLVDLERPRVPLKLDRRVDDALVIGYIDGTPVMRARPLPPRRGEPDLRVCAGCGGSMAGKRPQAKYCETCLPTVKNTQNVRRQRAAERRDPDRIDADLVSYAESVGLNAEQVRQAMRDLGSYRLRAILNIVTQDVEHVEVGDAAHRDYRKSSLRADDVDADADALTGVEERDGSDVLTATADLFRDVVEPMANRERTDNREAVRWPGLPDADGRRLSDRVRWNNGALIRLPMPRNLKPKSLTADWNKP